MTQTERYNRLMDAAHSAEAEAHAAMQKYPAYNSQHEGWAVLREEVDEMWQEVKHGTQERAVEEAIQVAAVALRFVAEFGGGT